MIFPVSNLAPSIRECSKPTMLGKPVIVVTAEKPTLVKRDNKVAESEQKSQDGCILKQGGKCITYGCMGVTYITTENKWDVKKDGTYRWKYLKKTRYKCQKEAVPASIRGNS